MKINRKSMCVAIVAALPLLVRAAEVPTLPPSEYADTEVSTNFAFAVGEGGGRRLVFSLELEVFGFALRLQ